MLHGDFGHSIQSGQAVLPLILQRFGVTLSVVLVAIVIASLLAVPAGMLAAWKQNSSLDTGLVMFSTFLLSIPSFWMGLLILLLLGLKLGWLPVVGYVSLSDDLKAGLLYLLMPVMTLVLVEIGALVRMMRASTLEVLRLDYVSRPGEGAARARGVNAPRFPECLRADVDPDWPDARQPAQRSGGDGNGLQPAGARPPAGGRHLRPRLSGYSGMYAVYRHALCAHQSAD